MTARHQQARAARLKGGFAGLLLAVLALVGQLAFGALVLPDQAVAQEQSVAALNALSILCDSSAPGPTGPQPGHHHRSADGVLCPHAVAFELPFAVLPTSPGVPAPQEPLVQRAGLPPAARAPPAPPRAVPPPRGPPSLT